MELLILFGMGCIIAQLAVMTNEIINLNENNKLKKELND